MATYQDRGHFYAAHDNAVFEFEEDFDDEYEEYFYDEYDEYEEPKLRKSKAKFRCTVCSTDWKSKPKLEKHQELKHSTNQINTFRKKSSKKKNNSTAKNSNLKKNI